MRTEGPAPIRTEGPAPIRAEGPAPIRAEASAPMRAERFFLLTGALSAFVAVAAGAFGAHGLRARVSPEMLAVFETGARYQMVHALALIAVAWAAGRSTARSAPAAGIAFLVGTVLFSGSLYLLALTGVRWLGAITPLGGIAFLVGWLCLAWSALRA